MSGIVLPNLGLNGDIPDHALWGTEGRANDRRLDALVMASAKDLLNDPPSSPGDGDRYIVGPAPSGLWAGKANSIASWNATIGSWDFYTPKTGWSTYLEDERTIQRYSGGWFIDDLFVNVKRFGATGDGATDDTNAVLAALAALPSYGHLHFPRGTYRLATWAIQALAIPAWLSGDGMGATVIKGTGGASFMSNTASLRVTDMTFDTWINVFDFSAISSVVEKVDFDSVEIKNYAKGIYGVGSTGGTGVRNFKVRDCILTTGSSYAIFLNVPIMERVYVENNVIKDCVQRAIDLGGNSLVFADDRGEYEIKGNVVEGVTAVGASAIAIIVYGWRATITKNIVKGVSRDVPTASDCDGIYTKCRYSEVSGNILIDAGQAEAFINIKGGARDETVSQPYGFSVVVANNVLVDTQINPTLAGGARATSGIKIATSEVLVADNYLEGLTELGIYTDSDSTASHPNHNIVIADNFVKNHRGKAAIAVYGRGDRIRLLDNAVDTVTNEFDPTAQNFGFDINKKEGNGIDIVGNRIYNIVDTTTTPVGIQISPGTLSKTIASVDPSPGVESMTTTAIHTFSLNDPVKLTTTGALPSPLVVGTTYYIKTMPTTSSFTLSATPGGAMIDLTDAGTGTHTVIKQTTLRSWRIADNHLENARYGIQFSWDQNNVAVDDVFVRHNTGRNINGTTPPVLADLVKYTDIPTNLIDLPARAETIARVSDNEVEIQNGGTLASPKLQDLKIYGFKDGANYERLSVRMDGTHATLDVEAGGTGTVEDLEVRFGGALKVKFTSSGRLEILDQGDYNSGHLVMGTYHLWVEAATGKLRILNGAPTSDSDGTVVGTQA